MTKVQYTGQQHILYPVPCTLPLLVSSVYIRLAHAKDLTGYSQIICAKILYHKPIYDARLADLNDQSYEIIKQKGIDQ